VPTGNKQQSFTGVQKLRSKWKGISCFWMGTFNILKKTIFPKLVHELNAILSECP
jgi:hypothetical protein